MTHQLKLVLSPYDACIDCLCRGPRLGNVLIVLLQFFASVTMSILALMRKVAVTFLDVELVMLMIIITGHYGDDDDDDDGDEMMMTMMMMMRMRMTMMRMS